MNAYSYSTLRGYAECPATLLYKRKRMPREESFPLLVGQQAHRGIEQYLKALVPSGLPSDHTLLPDIVASLRMDDGSPPPDKVRIETAMILDKFASNFVADLVSPQIELELAFDAKWNPTYWKDWTGCRWRAKVDLIERVESGVLRVTDWKTGFKVPTKEEAENDPQLPIYAFAASLLDKAAEEFRLRYYYVRQNYTTERVLYRDEVETVRKELEDRMAHADREKKFKHRPGPWCNGCFYRRACPGYKKAGLSDTIPDATAELADLYYLTKARLEDLNTSLRERVEHEGPLELSNGQFLGFHPTQKWKLSSASGIVDALLELGVERRDLWKALSIPKTKIGSLVGKVAKRGTKKKTVDGLLEEFGEFGVDNRFEARTHPKK